MVEVRFEDMVYGGNYTFRNCPSLTGHWPAPPRVGDHVLDGNEFKYRVVEVIWYNLYMCVAKVQRDEGR